MEGTILLLSIFIIIIFLIRRRDKPSIKGVRGEYYVAIKGARGEYYVARRLAKLDSNKYKVFNNVTIRTQRGSCQIDHVVISIYGIFVIETKNYSGWIHGHENSEDWTQTLYEKRYTFRNPVKQNSAHIYALKQVLPQKRSIPYFPIVVFAGEGELKSVYCNKPVIYKEQLIQTVERVEEPCLSAEEVDKLADTLSDSIQHSRVTEAEHIKYVTKQIHNRRSIETASVCPHCGVSLVVRNGKYGKFYGCPSYPKCKYTRPYKSL